MPDSNPSPTRVRSALFVDFDNIYLGLQREDPVAAEQFATDPTRWLLWLQDSLPNQDGDDRKRKILLGDSYHIITMDNERDLVARETIRFFQESIMHRHPQESFRLVSIARSLLRLQRARALQIQRSGSAGS